MLAKTRKKKCRHCREWFQPFNTLQRACSPDCALEVARADGQKEQRKATRQARERLKTRGDLVKEAQVAFNAFIRERDHGLPCISCGNTPNDDDLITGSRWDAGHYRSVGSNPELRFCELQVARQCVRCNRHLSGNVVNFRIGLLDRIGAEALDWVEGKHEPKKYTAEELREIRDNYRKKTRRLAKERENAMYG